MIKVSALLICAVTVVATTSNLKRLAAHVPDKEQLIELRYLPSGRNIKGICLGYRNVLADLLWFNTINYFGKHYSGDRDLRWLSHMCELVAELDPKAHHVYEFCGAMLAWEQGEPESAYKILSTGVKNLPDSWYMRYLRGFTALYFLKDQQLAKDDFVNATNIPGCPPFIARLAASTLTELEDPRVAVAFLNDMIERTTDEGAKHSLIQKRDSLLRQLKGGNNE